MAIWKGTFIINMGASGWTESYYLEADSIAAARTAMNSLLQVRNNCFGQDPGGVTPKVDFIRVSHNSGIPSELFPNNVGFKPVIFFDAPDMPWTAVLCKLSTANGNKRALTLRGVPDVPIVSAFTDPILGDLRTQVQAFLARLVNSEFRIRAINKLGVGALRSISNIEANANGSLRVTSTANHPFTQPGEYAYFYHVRASKLSLSGRHLVVPVTATTFDLPGFNVAQVGFESGEYRHLDYEYVGITTATVSRKTKHNTGRPFGVLRGRRPARKH